MAHAGVLAPRHGRAALGPEPVVCHSSKWLYTDRGGLLEVPPHVAGFVDERQVVALLRNAFGDVVREYRAPWRGIVVGKSTNPVGQTGSRIVHLGSVADPLTHALVPRH